MSEIEKLYELGNIRPFIHYQPVKDYNFGGDNGYKYNEVKYYPPFTAEKQLNLLQFCLKWGQVHILHGIGEEYRIENSYYRKGYQPTIADAIANYINEKWNKLTNEEQQQVKGILE